MAHSLALWYERWRKTPSAGKPPEVEVHLNLWRHVGIVDDLNFLDIGLLFSNTNEIGTFNLFFPTRLEKEAIEDLSPRLRDNTLLCAVFNDVISVGPSDGETSFETRRRGDHYLQIYEVVHGRDFDLKPVGKNDDEIGVTLHFTREFCDRIHAPGSHYIRLRIRLNDTAAAAFSVKKNPGGDFFLSTIFSEEFTEIRLNEMRNVPNSVTEDIKAAGGNLFNIKAAHCFFIRDMKFELVASHSSAHKIRRMEHDLWNGYLPKTIPPKSQSQMIVYHWRSLHAETIESFVALARFRQPRGSLPIYIVGIILLGAIGSSVSTTYLSWFGNGTDPSGNAWATAYLTLILVGISGLFWLGQRLVRWLGKVRSGR